MPLSSSAIIHFTHDKSSLIGILENDFKVRYCLEKIFFENEVSEIRVPMVSFCDIPLSQIKEHIGKYGSYGIGLSKEWAVENALNPVLYIERQSNLARSYATALQEYSLSGKHQSDTDADKALADVLRYAKNYQGTLARKGSTVQNYRYSDEREWRYVPPFQFPCEMLVGEDYYMNHKNEIDAPLTELRLKFTPNDIRYIIIKDDSEITEFIDIFRWKKGKNYSLHDVERLGARLLTIDQIMNDI